MFFFAVTRQRIAGTLDGPTVRAHVLDGWVVTTATDGQFSSDRSDAGRVVVEERAPNESQLLLAEVSFAAKERAIELHKLLIGGRQVYYHFAPNGDFFGASHARLLRIAGIRLEEDPERLPEFFTYRYVTAPRTLFRGIDQLIAGQRLRFESDGNGAWRRVAAELYTPPQPDPVPPDGINGRAAEYGRRTDEAIRHAMKLAARAGNGARPPHVLMSGGLDSSILFKMAQADLGVGESFSTSYPFEPEEEDVEKQYALTAADAMGARHRFFCPTTPQFLRGVLESTLIAEEPVVHMQSVLLMLLFRDGLPAGPGTVVVGQGADGAFGLKVHDRVRRLMRKAERYQRWQPLFAKRPVFGALWVSSKLTGRGRGAVEVVDQLWRPDAPIADPRHVLWWLGATGDPRWVRRRFPGNVNANRAAAIAPYQGRSAYDLISLLDFIGDVSVTQSIWSKLGEASGKWVYYPFNDPGVLDAAFAAPWEVKLAEPKQVLRDVARRVGVPEFIITRPKANFNANAKRWAAPGAAFEPLVPLAAKVCGAKELRRMQSPDDNAAFYTFWTMLTYAVWRRLVLDGEPLEQLAGELESAMAESADVIVSAA